jgi:hypothetical protein
MKTSQFARVLAFGVFSHSAIAHADLVPPGGEGVHACHTKKAGDACQNYVIVGLEQKVESGTCVEEKLDHLRFKFKAHLRCVSASVPAGSASVAKLPPSVIAPPPEIPSAATPAPSASSVAPNPISSASSAPEAPKSSGCAFAADPSSGVAFCFTFAGLGVLLLSRRRREKDRP